MTLALATGATNAAVVATFETDWVTDTITGGSVTSKVLGSWTQGGWETTDPGGSHTFVDIKATHSSVTGDRLFMQEITGLSSTATITLTGLAAFDEVSIDKLIVGAGGGIDHTHNDGIEVKINGTTVINVDLTARDRDGGAPLDVGTYLSSAPASVILEGWADTDTNGSEFISTRMDGWGHDALYDLGADPAFDNIAVSGAGTVTIEIIGKLTDGNGASEQVGDEQIVIGNFGASFSEVPEPTSALLAGLGSLCLLRRRRR